jgi:integrase
MSRRRSAGVVELPKGVHKINARGREYYYWHPGRGTRYAGKPVRLPNDPGQPEFWAQIRDLSNKTVPTETTLEAVIDEYLSWDAFLKKPAGTQDQYRRQLKRAKIAWGKLPADHLEPAHVLAMMDRLAATPGAANGFLGVMRVLSAWGVPRKKFTHPLTTGIKPFELEGGHRPWTVEQVKAAHDHLTGMARRGIMLALYTGQRGSDVVRMGWGMIDDGGFDLAQIKTGREIWCPIVPELAAEMADWEKRPGPFVLQADGRPYSRKRLYLHFDEQRKSIPALKYVTIHGLRATAVVRLRRAGLSTAQIQDIIGMSMAMIERYSRFADRKASGQAAIVKLSERRS